MRINVLFLGPARDFAGTGAAAMDVADPTTVVGLRELLAGTYPRLAGALPTIRFAVNEAFAGDDHVLREGDDVALIPPVSGGAEEDDAILVRLTQATIVAEEVRAFVTGDPALGGICTFEGATRGETDSTHGPLVRLDYEAYEGMAVAQMRRLAEEAMDRWSAGRVAIVHRLGAVPPGEVSVMIAVACGHRAESFNACRWLIDTLKNDVPIWKKNVFEGGDTRWVQPAE